MKTSLRFLTHRLEWPLCRVRREAAYELARLVREGVDGAAEALLAWISERELESEAAIGVSIIHAFELGPHIPVGDVVHAVRAPSFLSQALIEATYPGAPQPAAPFGYEPAKAPPVNHRDYFDRNQGQLVALRFRSHLRALTVASGRPFYERWTQEWSALQDRLNVPFSGRPDYVWASGAREDMASVQVRQTEVYISAYLRTLAYAVAKWGMPAERAVDASFEALPFSHGLALVRPMNRPKWSFDSLKLYRSRGVRKAADMAWRGAERMTLTGQKPLVLCTVDHDELNILRFTMRSVLVPASAAAAPPPAKRWREPSATVGTSMGMLGPLKMGGRRCQPDVTFLSVRVGPANFPRLQIENIISGIELANPELFGDAPIVAATSESLALEISGQQMSEWRHWYADWEPTRPKEIADYAGYITTIDARKLAKIVRQSGLVLKTVCQVDHGIRRYGYDAATFETEQFWL